MAIAVAVFNPYLFRLCPVVSGFPNPDMITASITYKFPMSGYPDLHMADFPVAAVRVMTRPAGVAFIAVMLMATGLSVGPVSMPVPVIMLGANPDPDPMIVVVVVMILDDGPGDHTSEESTEGGQCLVTCLGMA